ncbi:MAG: DEAD/DEAH box helicase [Candidatus Thermoplasmatota archaeon]|nr:DEAD/DEAH box helicase [Candidatus Thermoplasmatota archaeon]
MKIKMDGPLIIQNDLSLILETDSPYFKEVRDSITMFAELVKSPDHLHTYKIDCFSIWNAALNGFDKNKILSVLNRYAKYNVPKKVIKYITEVSERYGKVVLSKDDNNLVLTVSDKTLYISLKKDKKFAQYVKGFNGDRFYIVNEARGTIKESVMKHGYPVVDIAGYEEGDELNISATQITKTGKPFIMRAYQKEAVDRFWMNGTEFGGSGVIVLPCGAGKTIVGIGIISKAKTSTLILCPHTSAIKQWIAEIIDKTDIKSDLIGEYSGNKKEVKPITVATYQIFTRSTKENNENQTIFNTKKWGLIIYDEVHLLPAPVFRLTAKIQATRRVGMTATLIREDRMETEVFSLIGPKIYELGWKKLEQDGWIAPAICTEIRIKLNKKDRDAYINSTPRKKCRIAAENPVKIKVIKELIEKYKNEQILIIGQYITQLKKISEMFNIPMIDGNSSSTIREKYYQEFREGKRKTIIASRIANFALNLPETTIAIQVSGLFGSRQEEAQRLGRILRPKTGNKEAFFYTLISKDTKEEKFASKRQIFLVEQGYKYRVVIWRNNKNW